MLLTALYNSYPISSKENSMPKSKGKHFRATTRWTPKDAVDFLLLAAIVLCTACGLAFTITTIADGTINRLVCLGVAVSALLLGGILAVQTRRNHIPAVFAYITLVASAAFGVIAAINMPT
jgi:hypothetical protein